jgi:heme oxygenase
LTIENASQLAVRNVRGYLFQRNGDSLLGAFLPIPVAKPGETESMLRGNFPVSLRLLLVYDDDAGVRWRKYGIKHLERVKVGEADIGKS